MKYSVQHQRSAQWWTGSAWSTTQTWFNATVASPGADQHRLERDVDAAERRPLLRRTPPRVDGSGNQDATPADTDVTAELVAPGHHGGERDDHRAQGQPGAAAGAS